MKKAFKRITKKGFTLVELLAVIVILSIVMIISFPKIIELVKNKNAEISGAKLNLLYSATKAYMFDYQNRYPTRAGNTYCISPTSLDNDNYVNFDISDLDENYVIKVSIFDDTDDIEYTYVHSKNCTNVGMVNTELAGLNCTTDKSGYAVSKTVTVSYPQSDDFIYLYSLDNGKTWTEVKNFDSENKLFFNFHVNGSVLAKVKEKDSASYLSCASYIDNIDDTPIGTILAYSSSTIPTGYIVADGSSVSRSKYYELYSVISNSFGTPDNSKSFYLPDLSGRLITSVNSSDPDFAFAYKGGEKENTLTLEQLPSHTHTFTGETVTSTSGGAHTHTFNASTSSNANHVHVGLYWKIPDNTAWNVTLDPGNSAYKVNFSGVGGTTTGGAGRENQVDFITGTSGAHTHIISGTTGGISSTHTHNVVAKGTNSSVGSTESHNNLMPYYTLNYIIKYQ